VKNLPNGEIELSVDDSHWLEVQSGRVHYRIAGIPSEDFPDLPSSEDVEFFTIEAPVLSRLIEQSHFAISPDEARPHLNGALFEGEGKTLRMVATDGHRLCRAEHNVEQGKGLFGFSMLLPLKAIHELRRLLDEGATEVEVGASGPNAFFRRHVDDGSGQGPEAELTMSVKLVKGRFPPYEKVIPSTTDKEVVLARVPFLEALRRASLISREKIFGVRLTFNEGQLTVASDNPDVGEASEEVDAAYEGPELTVGFNARYLVDVLSALATDEVRVGLGGSTDACVLTPGDGEEGFLGVVMPMRL